MSEAGRRLADQIARWSTAAASTMAALLLGVIVFFYGSLPRDISQIREQLVEVRTEQRQLIDANRVNQSWRERLVDVEKAQDRHAGTLQSHERRLDRLEEPRRSGRP